MLLCLSWCLVKQQLCSNCSEQTFQPCPPLTSTDAWHPADPLTLSMPVTELLVTSKPRSRSTMPDYMGWVMPHSITGCMPCDEYKTHALGK